MARWARGAAAVIAGSVLWGILWNLGTQAAMAAFPEHLSLDQRISHIGLLLGYIAYSVVLSGLAGFVSAALAGRDPMPVVWTLAGVQLTLGIIAQVSYWNLFPAWYHIGFLGLVVPATIYGGKLRAHRGAVAR